MSPYWGIDLFVCVAQLAIAVVCLARVSRTRAARPIALFGLCVAAWSGATLVYQATGHVAWLFVDHAVKPLTGPLALDFALTFAKRRRAMRAPLAVAYVLQGGFGALAVVACFVRALRYFVESPAWVAWLLAMGIPTMVLAVFSFTAHLQRSVERIEEERTRVVLVAVVIGMIVGSTELLTPITPFSSRLLSLGRLGLLVSTIACALVSLDFPWFESPPRVRRFTYAMIAFGVGLLLYLATFGFPDSTARLVLGTIGVTAAIIAASRRWMIEAAVTKERASQLATLGRFSAQMAHDIKNPLAALKGAAQLLRDDVAAPAPPAAERSGPTPRALVELMLEEIDRIGRVVEVYGRLARIDVAAGSVDVNEVVREVSAIRALAKADGVTLHTDLLDGLPRCAGDRDLLASAVENLVRNAVEALPSGGTVTVRTLHAPVGETPGVVVVVEDDGVGMDAQTRERAFDDFFTTKPTGSGLGLAFVRRVVHAHGGEVALTSASRRGTVVRVRLPAT